MTANRKKKQKASSTDSQQRDIHEKNNIEEEPDDNYLAKEGSPGREINSPKDKQRKFDPDGTAHVARGVSIEKAKESLEELNSRADDKVLQFYQSDLDRQRLDLLRKDDDDPNLSNLSDKQKRQLSKRSNGKANAVLVRHEAKRLKAAFIAADAADILQTDQPGLLEAENDMERTTSITQTELKRKYLDEETARHVYDLTLRGSSYGMEYDRSGRYNVLYGHSNGHLALMDCHEQKLLTEFYVHERIRDSCFLHNFSLFAVAQKHHAFIYDHTGAEIHRLDEHNDPMALQFLPYHWLLASIGRAGWLTYQDTSTGQVVSRHRTKLGACNVLRQNPSNAIIHAGHSNGVVTLWSPASSTFLAKILCHKGAAVHCLAIDQKGHTMVTGGADRKVCVWDLRMYKQTHTYITLAGVPKSLDISQRGILGIADAGHARFWGPEAIRTKVKSPYMHQHLAGKGPIETLRFRPFEDVCGIGHACGVSSLVIPGSGEPSLDTAEYNLNPMQDVKQRREAEVRALLDKLRPEMISLDANQVGGIEESDPHRRLERIRDEQENANAKYVPTKKEKSKKRGRSKIQTQLRRKQRNVVDQNTQKLREARDQEKALKASERGEQPPPEHPKEQAPSALRRFF